jgi:hypothetical protein
MNVFCPSSFSSHISTQERMCLVRLTQFHHTKGDLDSALRTCGEWFTKCQVVVDFCCQMKHLKCPCAIIRILLSLVGTDCPFLSDGNTQSTQQSHQHKFECSLKAIELLIEQRNFGGLFERISQVLFVSLDALLCTLSVPPRQP